MSNFVESHKSIKMHEKNNLFHITLKHSDALKEKKDKLSEYIVL